MHKSGTGWELVREFRLNTRKVLQQFTTAELLEEVARRANAAEPEEIRHWCEECQNFEPKTDADDRYNPCTKKHRLRYRAPRDWSEVVEERYGFFRLVCSDRDPVNGTGEAQV